MRVAAKMIAFTILLAIAAPGVVHSQQLPTVTIQDFEFRPGTLRVKIPAAGTGQQVRWVNNGPATHTVTADRGTFNAGPLARGGGFSFTFTSAGTFDYHCDIHSTMKGQVVVEVEPAPRETDDGY